ncbi:hypothetical protein Hbl1158_10940 [Halobaculum sp. CBA1158]|uniref:hypothetical protein n=1 Tax=Halobaculum sp. CBA1158 TaxID=2904243 RepID=UPI001F3F0550|nr:hypothetical protein [Halobaculum sp. CBA1158]UIO99047.1 hypothetical protein Hbl1158_10940 [Halobaculum sp. CBA1158]
MRRAVALALVSLLVAPIVASVLWTVDERAGIAIAGATIALVAVLLVARLRTIVRGRVFGGEGAPGSESGEGDEGDGWSLVPDWQYEGRFAEAGGITRSEQEQALREIDERAEREQNRTRE